MGNGRSLARINAAGKRQRVVDARSEGHTWAQCAEIAGYQNPESAIRAFDQAMREKPHRNAEQWRSEHVEQLQAEYARLGQIIGKPPIKTTSIGRTQWDPRTCTCGAKGAPDHAESCGVQPVLDERAVIAAITERRQIGESLRRLLGVDLGAGHAAEAESADYDELMEWARGIVARNAELTRQNGELLRQLSAVRGLSAPEIVDAIIVPDGTR